jgi:hypothetical protein
MSIQVKARENEFEKSSITTFNSVMTMYKIFACFCYFASNSIEWTILEKLKASVFWVAMLCNTVVGYKYFRVSCCLHLQCEMKMDATWTSETLVSSHITWCCNP